MKHLDFLNSLSQFQKKAYSLLIFFCISITVNATCLTAFNYDVAQVENAYNEGIEDCGQIPNVYFAMMCYAEEEYNRSLGYEIALSAYNACCSGEPGCI